MLVSPLTERPYFLFLLIPLIGLFCWLREVGVTDVWLRRAAAVAVLIWVLLAGPAELAEYVLDTGVTVHGQAAPLFTLLAPVYLWVTVAAFVLQLLVVAHARGLCLLPAVGETVRGAPGLLLAWIRDAGLGPRGGPAEPGAGLSGDPRRLAPGSIALGPLSGDARPAATPLPAQSRPGSGRWRPRRVRRAADGRGTGPGLGRAAMAPA